MNKLFSLRKISPLIFFSLFLSISMLSKASDDNDNWSLGSIGGTFRVQPGTNYLEVKSVEASGPGGVAGLQVGDYIFKAFGNTFGELSIHSPQGYKGSAQDLAIAIERAEAGNGALELTVMRPGVGEIVVNVSLPAAGAFGPAYPLGSTKFDTMYQWGCEQIHLQTTASSDGNFGYDTGLYGLILISHPNWNDTSGAKPYRPSVDKLKDWCVTYLQGRILDPVEAWNLDGTPNDGSTDDSDPTDQSYVNPGLENWTIATAAMFLAEYRQKTSDTAVDATVQRAADMLANRVQEYQQPPLSNGNPGPTKPGLMGHAGVGGDYSSISYAGLNIINAHALPALAMLEKAGATINATQFANCWLRMKESTRQDGGDDDGNVGYGWVQGGSDSGGRTAGAVAGMLMRGGVSAANQLVVDKQKAYLSRQWQRFQHCHAYTVGGVFLYQFALPYLDDRDQRFIMENSRYFYHYHRNTGGTLTYFGGRENNGGDGYLNLGRVAIMNTCIAQAVHSGNLPSFPAINSARLHADFISPALTWPTLDARYLKTDTGSLAFSNVNVTDYLGSVLNTSDYSVTWSHVSGPATATFSNSSNITPTVTFPAQGRYRIQLEVSKDGYTLTEPIDIDYFPGTAPAGYVTGGITEEIYTGISGTETADLLAAASYPGSPNITKTITSIEGTHDDNSYGSRIRGYIIAPVTGDYTFYVSGDNNADFYLSTDDTEANKVKVCYTTTWTDAYEWDQDPTQTSSAISLTAGQAYFFEVIHKASAGGDHVAVAWTFPGLTDPEVIAGDNIAQQGSGATAIVTQPQNVSVAAGGNATMEVVVSGAGPFLYQWRKDGVAYWPASSSANLQLTNIGAGAAGDYDCVITGPDGTVTTNVAELTVTGVGVLTQGGLWRDVFSGVTGTEVSQMVALTNYPYFPDSGAVITTAESPQDEAENYGARWSGWVKPDETGAYTFYLTGDNTAELWLSTDDQPANIVKVTEITTHTGYREWQHSAAGVTVPINLVNGNRYYIEVRHKESKVGDHCGVAWQKPGEAAPVNGADAAIPSQYLEYLTGGVYFTHTSVSLSRVEPASDNVRIRPNVGLELECSASSTTSNATITWTKQSGPGAVTFSDSSSLATDAMFSVEGNYVLRCTYDNGGVPATYDINVEVTSETSASWNSVSIGEPTTGNGVDNGDGTFTVQGSGNDIFGSADECHLFKQDITGDFDVRARVVSKSLTSSFGTHAQLMARESGATNSRNIAVTHERVDRVAFQYRSGEGSGPATTYKSINNIALPMWIRLVRSGGNPATGAAGQTFTGYYSTDNGVTWIQRETVTFSTPMPDTLMVGFAVASAGSSLNTAVYDNVSGFAVAENVAAVPNAGSDFTTTALTGQALSGSSTDDSLPMTPGAVTHLWTKVSGPGDVTFADASVATTTADFTQPGVYVLRLTADDGSAKTFDEVTVTAVADFTVSIAATDNAAAGDGSDAGEFTVTRTGDTTNALTVNLAIAGSATNGTDYTTIANTVEIPATQSSVTIAVSPLFDAVQEGAETVEVGIAAGNYNSVTTAAVVTIADTVGVNAPVISDATFAVAENLSSGAAVGTVVLTDADNGDVHTFTITAGNTGSAFAINNQGEITTAAVLDRETTASYTLTVEVEDSGSLTDTATITVNVTDVHESPVTAADSLLVNANAASGVVDVLVNDLVNGGSTAQLKGFANEAITYNAGTSGSPVDPTTVGWSVNDTEDSDPAMGNIRGEGSANDNGSGLDAWVITDNTNNGSEWIQYRQTPTADQVTAANANGWALETKLRYVDDFNDGNSFLIQYGNGSTRFLVFFDLNGDDDLTAQLIGTGGELLTLTTGGTGADNFHDIGIYYDPTTSKASFFVDGVRHDSGNWEGASNSITTVEMGTGSSGGQGSAAVHSLKWSYFDTTGTLASGATISASGSNVTFNPNNGYQSLTDTETALEEIRYAVSDGAGYFGYGTLNVTIQGVDDLPAFDSDPVVAPNANSIFAYTGASLANYGSDPDDAHTFSKVSGPAWLSVASDGTLTGSPTASDAGLNIFTVEVSNGKGHSAQTTLEITVDGSINVYMDDFEGYDVKNPSDFSVGGTPTTNWVSSDLNSDATRIFNSSNFGGTRLWISNIDGTSLTSAGITVDSNRHYSMSAVMVTETGNAGRTLNANYDILVGQTAATATSIIGGPQAVVTNGDAWQTDDSKEDHVFTQHFQTGTLNPGDKVFLRYQRVDVLSTGGWFGLDDVKVDLTALNTAPTLADATFSVDEEVAAATAVGTVTGADVDAGDSLSYSITAGNADGIFAIDSMTGAITTTATAPDYEVAISHALTVTVTDGSGATDTATVTINVNDLSEDADSDGLADDWEVTNFGNITTVDGTADSDGDGQIDSHEYAAKTDPNDQSDMLEIISIVKDTSKSTVDWSSKSGVSYKLQYSYDLSAWTDVVTNQSGSAGQMSYEDTDSTRAAAPKVFYRVVVE